MIIPVRCISCGKPVAQHWDEYNERVDSGEDKADVLDDIGLERYCCRSLFLTHTDLLPKVAKFKKG